MSDAFNNFLSGGPTTSTEKRTYKSYAHATNFYAQGRALTKVPKLGFIYFISFNLAQEVGVKFADHVRKDLGFLAKKVDLPKFKITTQTVNQYNRKTNVQTKLAYDPISIDFHDDTSEITSALWRAYYDFYYADGRQPDGQFSTAFSGDTKLDSTNNSYGYSKGSGPTSFFSSIDIFVLNQGRFSQYSISNPLITSWDHDTLEQSNGTKVLQNKMSLTYDSVVYSQGFIRGSENQAVTGSFEAVWYDKDANLPFGYNDPLKQVIKPFVPQYPTPSPPGLSQSQLDKLSTQVPTYRPPRPIGAGTFGLSSIRPPKPFSIDVWYGYGGLHGRATVNAGPVRLVLKK